jgi:PKD domain
LCEGSRGGAATFTYSYNWGDGTGATAADTHVYATVGSYIVTVSVTDSLGNAGTDTFAFATWGLNCTAYGPTRLLDTRNGTGAIVAKVPAKGTVKLST